MQNRNRIIKITGYAAGVLLVLLVCLALLLPKLINTEWVKKELLQILSQKISGTMEFRSVAISLFPVPRLSIDQARIAVPGKLDATIATLDIFPEFIPLLQGEARISKLQAQEPLLALHVSDRKGKKLLSAEQVSAALTSLVSDTAGLTFSIEKGSLSILNKGSAPATLQRIDARVVAESKKGRVTVTLEKLKIDSPRLTLSGFLSIQPTSPRIRLDIRAKGLPVRQTGEFLLSAAGEMPLVRSILDILRDGTIPDITFHSRADSIEDLGGAMNTEIKGELGQGSIHIPGPMLDFTAVNGVFTVSKGVLNGTDITGRYGKSSLRQTSLTLDVKGDDGPLRLETLVRADLEEALLLLRRLVKDKAFLQELNRIQSMKGTAAGKLFLGGALASLETGVAISEMNLSARHQYVPFPVTLAGGSFTYDKEQISVEDLSATIGRSSAAGIRARLDTGTSPQIDIRSAQATIDAGEIYGWLAAREEMKDTLREISAVSGVIALSALELKGPLSTPKEWRFRTTGAADNLVISTPSLPDRLALRQGRFTLSPGSIVLEAATSMQDITATLSGILMFSPEGLRGADVMIEGDTGPKGMKWIKTVAGLPPLLKVQQRLSLARGHIVTSGKGELSFQGAITTSGGQALALDLVNREKALKINRLDVEDKASRASMTLDLRERSWDMTFSGRMDSSTVAALIELEQVPAGHLAGDFKAHILRDRPWESQASGRLSGERIVLPWKPGIPLHIDAMSISADGSRISVQSSRLRLADMALSSSGTLAFGKDGLDMNLEIETKRMDWASLERIMRDEKTATPAGGGGASSKMPVRGKAKITAQEFVYAPYTVSPLHADISFSPDRATVNISKALFCNIDARGRIELAGGNRNMEVTLSAKDQDLGSTLACFPEKGAEMTGRFSLDGTFSLSQTDPPLRGLEGSVSFRARDGRISKSIPLSGAFSLMSATEYFRGLPDLRKEGFAYSTFTIAGDVHQGRLSVKEAAIDGPTMLILAEGGSDWAERKIDMTVLVAPFKTLDGMFKILPGRKGDSHASLVSMAVKVTGDMLNPDFSVQPITGISRGLTGVMERVLKAPVRIIESFNPSLKE